jgi:hypothetical protein
MFVFVALSGLILASVGAGQSVKPSPIVTNAQAADPTTKATPQPSDQAVAVEAVFSSEQMYVFVINGVDPLWMAGLKRLGDQIRQCGYPNTKVIGLHEASVAEKEIRCLYRANPTARFTLIGYSAGTYVVKAMAGRLVRDGVPVAMVGYVGGDYLRDSSATQLTGVGRVVNVTGDGYLLTGKNLLFNGTCISGAKNVRLAGTRHFNLPNHPSTYAALIEGLNEASAR